MIQNYYTVETVTRSEGAAVYSVALNPDCEVYKGHFPGEPISPGVCSIRMIEECAETETGMPLQIEEVQVCRLTALITPVTHPKLDISISLSETEDGKFNLRSSITKGEETCLTLKAVLKKRE